MSNVGEHGKTGRISGSGRTINVKAPAGEYITGPDQLELLAGVADAIRRLNQAEILSMIVTNQRGIALGQMTEGDLAEIHSELQRMLRNEAGARLDAIVHCPHGLDQCGCRKPHTGMLDAARQRFPGIEPDRSVMIGDSASDVEAGRRFGARTIWLGRDVPDLAAAVDRLLAESGVRAVSPFQG